MILVDVLSVTKVIPDTNIPPQLVKIDNLLILGAFNAWSPDRVFFYLLYMSNLANLMDGLSIV